MQSVRSFVVTNKKTPIGPIEPESEFRERIKWACECFTDATNSTLTEDQARDCINRLVYWTDVEGTDDEKLVYVAIDDEKKRT